MLKLAKNVGLTDIISEDGSNPITTQHPIEGSAETVQVYLFNDNASKRYENVTIAAKDNTGSDESDWLQFSTDGDTFANELSMGNIEDTNGHSFYVRVTTPTLDDTQNKDDIKINITGTEFAV